MSNCECRRNNQDYNYMFINNNSNNINNNPFPNNYLYGHAYTPNQKMNKTFMPKEGLRNGTMFPELVSMYMSDESIDFINYLRNGGR